jgi:hypothetical protein
LWASSSWLTTPSRLVSARMRGRKVAAVEYETKPTRRAGRSREIEGAMAGFLSKACGVVRVVLHTSDHALLSTNFPSLGQSSGLRHGRETAISASIDGMVNVVRTRNLAVFRVRCLDVSRLGNIKGQDMIDSYRPSRGSATHRP